MRFDIMVLRAMLRLSRRRESTDLASLQARVGGEGDEPAHPSQVRAALGRLHRAGLVTRTTASSAQLTMAGFAVAVATLKMKVKGEERRVARRSSQTRAA